MGCGMLDWCFPSCVRKKDRRFVREAQIDRNKWQENHSRKRSKRWWAERAEPRLDDRSNAFSETTPLCPLNAATGANSTTPRRRRKKHVTFDLPDNDPIPSSPDHAAADAMVLTEPLTSACPGNTRNVIPSTEIISLLKNSKVCSSKDPPLTHGRADTMLLADTTSSTNRIKNSVVIASNQYSPLLSSLRHSKVCSSATPPLTHGRADTMLLADTTSSTNRIKTSVVIASNQYSPLLSSLRHSKVCSSATPPLTYGRADTMLLADTTSSTNRIKTSVVIASNEYSPLLSSHRHSKVCSIATPPLTHGSADTIVLADTTSSTHRIKTSVVIASNEYSPLLSSLRHSKVCSSATPPLTHGSADTIVLAGSTSSTHRIKTSVVIASTQYSSILSSLLHSKVCSSSAPETSPNLEGLAGRTTIIKPPTPLV